MQTNNYDNKKAEYYLFKWSYFKATLWNKHLAPAEALVYYQPALKK